MGVRFNGPSIEFNGTPMEFVWGRSSFKLANILTYHFTGQGSKYSLRDAERWIAFNQEIFGQHVVLRVLLETEGWSPSDDTMFGSEPRDQGFWNVPELRSGRRPEQMHPIGKAVLKWLFQKSQETGVAFELVIDATLKHTDGIGVPMETQVIRQTLVEMRKLQWQFPNALVIPNVVNEVFAHSQWTIGEANMLAVRADRFKSNLTGETRVSRKWLGGEWEPEQWPGAPLIIDESGGDTFKYNVGPEAGKFQAVMLHPDRAPGDRAWYNVDRVAAYMVEHSNGMPVGFTESMYYVEEEDVQRAERWYRTRSGWNHVWPNFEKFYQSWPSLIDYGIVHDEKGVQCDPEWPRAETRMEAFFRSLNGGVEPHPNPTPVPDPDPDPEPVPSEPAWKVRVDTPEVTMVERPPQVVFGGDEKLVLRDSLDIRGKRGRFLQYIYVFRGLDRGDIVECDVNIYDGQVPIALSSWHKEIPDNFDAWECFEVGEYIVGDISVDITCRVTGKNKLLPGLPEREFSGLTARPHYGIYFVWGEVVQPNPNPAPTPEPSPKKETDYIPWDDREFWANKIENAYSVWRGDRDLEFLLVRPAYIVKYVHPEYTANDIADMADKMHEAHSRAMTLAWRIRNEKHREFEGRSQVRKSVANAMEAEMRSMTALYMTVRDNFPQGAEYDSIQGFIQFMEGSVG